MPDNTPKIDTSKMIFVFGSNEGGIHGGCAARFAYKERGARWGLSYGHFGQSFAIPTKGFKHFEATEKHPAGIGVGDTLSLPQIDAYVRGFLAFAYGHPELQFQVTCIGCGLAGLNHEDVAPMFSLRLGRDPRFIPENLWFDEKWRPYLQHLTDKFWGEG